MEFVKAAKKNFSTFVYYFIGTDCAKILGFRNIYNHSQLLIMALKRADAIHAPPEIKLALLFYYEYMHTPNKTRAINKLMDILRFPIAYRRPILSIIQYADIQQPNPITTAATLIARFYYRYHNTDMAKQMAYLTALFNYCRGINNNYWQTVINILQKIPTIPPPRISGKDIMNIPPPKRHTYLLNTYTQQIQNYLQSIIRAT